MDAWEQLISSSTINDGDSWDHLNAQSASTPREYVILSNSMDIIIETSSICADIIYSGIEIDIEQSEIMVELNNPTIDITIYKEE